jgi:Tol biopolymer transport system component
MWTAGISIAALLLLGALTFWLRSPLPPPRVLRYVRVTNDGQGKLRNVPSLSAQSPLVTDGSRLYFVETIGGGVALAQVSAAGGETALVSAPSQYPQLADISPNYSELLVISSVGTESDAPVTVLRIPAGSPRRLGELLAHDATWSPDGEKLTYAYGNALYLAKSDGTESRQLVALAGRPYWLRWSHDGSVLRFTLLDLQTFSTSLWEVAGDGTRLRPLLPGWNNPAAECCGNWTPDGRYFVFQSGHNSKTDIWAIPEKGSLFQKTSPEPVQLTAGQMDTLSPVPSRDGKKLFIIGALPRGELVRYDSKSGQWVPYLSGISAQGVDFSRDGQWVTYVTHPEGTLWRSKVDGTERLQLTFPPLGAFLPRWSPNGRQIAFAAVTPGKPRNIYLISAEGGSAQPVTQEQYYQSDAGWSADGNRLVFDSQFSRESESVIRLLDLRNHQMSKLPGSEGLFSPRWSPDGRYIAAMTGDSQKLMLYDFTSQKWVELAKLPMEYPCWSRSGKYVYFDLLSQSDPAAYRVRISDRKLERMVSLKGLRRALTIGAWAGLAPDDSSLLLRDVGSQEIYALDWEAP